MHILYFLPPARCCSHYPGKEHFILFCLEKEEVRNSTSYSLFFYVPCTSLGYTDVCDEHSSWKVTLIKTCLLHEQAKGEKF